MSREPATGPGALRATALAALGVVFGDLGTSPLYTLQTVVEATGGRFTAETALGVLSLIVWTLIIIVSVKYCVFVMRADNHGEGGILALMSLVGASSPGARARALTVMGLLGAALIYGDGVITPAISVLSALEGVNVATDALKPWIMPLAAVVLVAFFAVQRAGAGRIGAAFGPIMLAWFAVIGALGLSGVVRHPEVLAGLNPAWGLRLLARSGGAGAMILGGVFLCVTGAEALYADMGHFGARAIRLAWYAVVLPGLLLSYAGQAALLIADGRVSGNPFFELAPRWAVYPLVGLSTIATIIASQSIITGAFSMTRQAMQLGWLPGVSIRQTSDRVYGQIYVPVVNGLMMAATLAVTLAFRSSDRLAGAYGSAVSTTMMLTTGLLFTAMIRVWRWPVLAAAAVAGGLLAVDVAFFGANLLKIADGGWLPLALGGLIVFVMLTWRSGLDAVRARLVTQSQPPARFFADLAARRLPRTRGVAVFLTRTRDGVPPLILEHVRHMGALHDIVLALTVEFEERPRTPPGERCAVEELGHGLWRVRLRYGFTEMPDVPAALAAAPGLPHVDFGSAVYFASRDLVVPRPRAGGLPDWRAPLFPFLYRNSVKAFDRFRLPPRAVVEIGREIEI